MGKIIAIGGGGFTSKEYEERSGNSNKKILQIDEEIIKFAPKSKPNFLFIPTASSDDAQYIQKMKEIFSNKLGAKFNTLLLIKEKPNFESIKKQILNSDIIYVGGGNTLKMMNLWRKLKVDQLLIDAYKENKVMCGASAGSICWFRQGNSDSRKYKNSDAPMIKVTGLGIVDALHCPHYDSEAVRKPTLQEMMKKVPGVAIAIDDYCAIQILDDKYKIISSRQDSNAYKVYWNKDQYFEEKLDQLNKYSLISELLKKSNEVKKND